MEQGKSSQPQKEQAIKIENTVKEDHIKEDRIRKIALSYYSRKDICAAILKSATGREVVPRYFEGFGKRPDTISYESDIFELAKKGATSFHCSEEIWRDPLELSTGMQIEQLNGLRQGWDLVIDIDSKYIDYSKVAAELIITALEYHGVRNIGIKFSGSKGFHIIVPAKAFPSEVFGQKTVAMFPEWPRAICLYLNELIKRELIERITTMMMRDRKSYVKMFEAAQQVMPDIVLVSSRHLFRMPYSLHEKTSLASAVIDRTKISSFNITDADPFKVRPRDFIPESIPGEARELLIQALDNQKSEAPRTFEERRIRDFGLKIQGASVQGAQQPIQQGRQGFDEIVIKDLTPELYPPTIKEILNGMKTDGRKRALFILLNFFRSLKMENEKIEAIIIEWNSKNYHPLMTGYVKSQLSWHFKQKPKLPPNFDKPHYKEIGLNPTEQELKSKNPVTYVIRKNFFRQRNFQKEQKVPRIKRPKKIAQQNSAQNQPQNLQTKVF